MKHPPIFQVPHVTKANKEALKAVVNEETLLPTMFLGLCKLGNVLRTQNVSEENQNHFVSQTQNLCPQQIMRSQANGETFVSKTIYLQQCVLICQGLKVHRMS